MTQTQTVNENDTYAEIPIRLSARLPYDLTVYLKTENGSALSGQDFIITDNFTIPANTISDNISITLINDSVVENQQYFRVILDGSDNPDSVQIDPYSKEN